MDIEIAVVNHGENKFLASVSNFEIDYKSKLGIEKTDFSVLRMEITETMLNVPLLIFFRSSNYTHDELKIVSSICESLFVEIEFRSANTAHVCDLNAPTIVQNKNAIRLQSSVAESKGI
jgi:hypothetical protein